jgi:hypothetical protein
MGAGDAARNFGTRDSQKTKYFVMIHGFNVSQDEARTAYNELYKRVWWLGFRGNFVGLTWTGNVGLVPATNFDDSVANAFRTSPSVMNFLRTASGTGWAGSADNVDVMAHSLGNLVLWDALRLQEQTQGAIPVLHNMINLEAAIWSETFDPRQAMVYNREANGPRDNITYQVADLQRHSWRFWFNQGAAGQAGDVRRALSGQVYHSFNPADNALAWMRTNDMTQRGTSILPGSPPGWHYNRGNLPGGAVWRDPLGQHALANVVPSLLQPGQRTPGYNTNALSVAMGTDSNPLAATNQNATRLGWRNTEHSDYLGLEYPRIYGWYDQFLSPAIAIGLE